MVCIQNNIDILTETASFGLDVWIQLVWENELLEGVNVYDADGLDEFIRNEPGRPHSLCAACGVRLITTLTFTPTNTNKP